MKHGRFIVAIFGLFGHSALAKPVHHLPLDLTGAEYRQIFEAQSNDTNFMARLNGDPLADILGYGKRNLDWIEAINKTRDDAHKIELTTPESTVAIPITAPRKTNRNSVQTDLENLKKNMPQDMQTVIFGTDTIPNVTTQTDENFTIYARQMNRVYESASRWLLEEPDLVEYASLISEDIRGYYFLTREENLKDKLNQWANLDEKVKSQYTSWLIGMCLNSEIETCDKDLATQIQANKVYDFFNLYLAQSKKVYDRFFKLQNAWEGTTWNAKSPNTFSFPFLKPDLKNVEDWFKFNVEDEFKFGDWSLKIDYQIDGYLPHIEFVAGTTPHVNGIGGDTITMDGNRSLQEYAVRWTIRHEFGHVLGFPDCYVEFYDQKSGYMINYQIDITNLMCSRRGHLLQTHYDELKKNYFTK